MDELGEWGWLWHIPLRESTSIGLIVPVEEVQTVKKSDEALEQYFLRKCYEVSYLARLLEPATYIQGSFHVIRDYSYKTSLYAGPGFYLVGDAAAFVDPLFSVGVVFAMYGAFAAAWAVDRSLRNPASDENNRGIFTRQIQGRLEVARALALPRYAKAGQTSELARMSIQFESALEKELMYTVASLSTRGDNLLDLVADEGKGRIEARKFNVIKELTF